GWSAAYLRAFSHRCGRTAHLDSVSFGTMDLWNKWVCFAVSPGRVASGPLYRGERRVRASRSAMIAMKTNANKSAASAAFPSTRLAAPARSLRASRARLAGSEARASSEKRLKAVGSVDSRASKASVQKGRNLRVAKVERVPTQPTVPTLPQSKPLAAA